MGYDLYTFHLVGGNSFTFRPEFNPAIVHDGGTSVFHLMLRQEDVELVAYQIRLHGGTLDYRVMDRQTDEQRKERLALLGRGKENKAWPSIKCPSCFWFDPTQDDPCGFYSWETGVVSASLEAHEKARTDRETCPVEET